jgi:pimeloyl-ACP methyl ester carboxylesterase
VYGEGGGLMNVLFKLMLARPWGPAVWRKYFTTLFTSRKPDDLDTYTQALYTNLKQPERMAAFRAMTQPSQGPKAEAAERMQRIDLPALVVMGSKDPDFKDPQAEAQWIAEQLRGRVEMIPGAGHYPHAEMPEVAGPVIVSFLETIRQKETIHAA